MFGQIYRTKGRISEDRNNKATLPLTIPCSVFKSSAKDLISLITRNLFYWFHKVSDIVYHWPSKPIMSYSLLVKAILKHIIIKEQ